MNERSIVACNIWPPFTCTAPITFTKPQRQFSTRPSRSKHYGLQLPPIFRVSLLQHTVSVFTHPPGKWRNRTSPVLGLHISGNGVSQACGYGYAVTQEQSRRHKGIPATFEMDLSADKSIAISGHLLEQWGDHLSTYSGLPQSATIGFASSTRTLGTMFSFLCQHSQSSS